MSVAVRAVGAGDAEGRAHLWRESGRYFAGLTPDTAQEPEPEGLVEWFDELYRGRAHDPTVLMLVAEMDGEIVGELLARLVEPLPSARWQLQRDLTRRRVHVDALAVAGAHRRAGVGTLLMTAAERWAVEHRAAAITLETGLDNPTSMPFYEHRMGYTRHEVVFRKPLR